MRNPQLWRNAALALFATGPVAILATLQVPADAGADAARAMGFGFGVLAIIFGGVGALITHLNVRALQALDRGEDVLARWRVDAAAWRDFIALNHELDQSPDALHNELSIDEPMAADGIAVVVGKTAIEIDGSIHRLPARGTPEITHAEFHESRIKPSYIELALYYPGGGYGASGVPQEPTRTCLCFPIASGAQRDAERVVAHYGGNVPGTPDFFHGPGDGSDSEDLSTCLSCGFETYRLQSQCPKCGGPLLSRRWSRRTGVVMVVCGLLITAIIGVVLYYLMPLLLHPGVEIDGSRFDATPRFALGVLGILGVVLSFGVISLGYGAWQIKTGRRNKKVMSAMMGIASLLMMVAWLLRTSGA
jgi:hypothetical protein